MLKVQNETGNSFNLMGSVRTDIKRARTEDEKRIRNLQKYKLQPPCPSTCRRKCSSSFKEEYRQDILTYYWSLNFAQRRE